MAVAVGAAVLVHGTKAGMRVEREVPGTMEDRVIGKVTIVRGGGIRRVLVPAEIAPVLAESRGTPAERRDTQTPRAEIGVGEGAPSRATRATTSTASEAIRVPVETEERDAESRAPTRVVGADKAAAQDMVATEASAGQGMRSPEVAGTRRERVARAIAVNAIHVVARQAAKVENVPHSGEVKGTAGAIPVGIGIELRHGEVRARAQWVRSGVAIWWVRLWICQSG